jgi:hypothetical protein
MSTEYPDVLGDLVESRERFEVNGVQYLTALTPSTVAPGATTQLRVWLQNCWEVPAEVRIRVQLPAQPAAAFKVIQERTDVPLEAAEVGEVAIPIACTAETEPGEYPITIGLSAKLESRGQYIRSKEHEGHLDKTSLRFTVGMSLASSVGTGYVAHTQAGSILTLEVQGPPHSGAAPELIPTYLSHWTVDELSLMGKARQFVNDRRLYLLPQITRHTLYLNFLEESRARFGDAALDLHLGESVFLAKILTGAVEHFMQHPDLQDAILLPAYTLAFRHDLQTEDPVALIVRADYARITRLAISLSFGLLRQQIGRDPWTMEEQLAVTELVADRVERGGTLSAEFLYLPLLLGGLMVASEVQMPGEDLNQSLDLLAKARQKREADLKHNQELIALLDRMERQARSF